jgi:two-component system NtrC family sensor kinase
LNIYSVASLVASTTCWLLGLFVLVKDPKNPLNRSFALIVILTGTWSIFPFLASMPLEDSLALLLTRVLYFFAAFVPAAWCIFVFAILGLDKVKTEQQIVRALLVTSTIFAAISFTSGFISGIVRYQPFSAVIPGLSYVPFVLFFAGGCGYGYYRCYKSYLQSVGAKRNQLKYILAAFGFAYIAGFMHFVASYLHTEPFPHDFLLIIFAGLIAYAIAKYRLMDITVVINKSLAYSLMVGLIFVPASLAVLVSHRATPYSIPPLITANIIFACGLWIVLKNPRAKVNITFGSICLAVCFWLFGVFMMFSAGPEQEIIFWGKVALVGAVFIPAFFYHFCVNFLQRDAKKGPILISYLISTVFLALIPSDLLVNGRYSYFWGSYLKAGPLHPVFLVYFASVSGVALKNLYVGYKAKKETSPLESTRIQYVFWAFVIGYIASLDFIQHYGIGLYPAGSLFACLWVVIVSYAILRYQLLEIAQITRSQLLPYAQVFALIPSYFVILGLIRVFTGTMQYILAGILLATFAVLAEVLVSIQKQMEKAVEYTLFRKKYDAYETLTEFSKALVAILQLKDLNEKIIGTISRVLEIDKISLFLLDKEKDYHFWAAGRGIDAERFKDLKIRRFAHYLENADRFILKEELEQVLPSSVGQKAVLNTMALLEAELCIPLRNKDRVIGFMNLGHKANLNMYTQEDLSLLFTLAQNAAIALDNALLYEDLRKQKALIHRTDRLRSLETIAGGFAHEIRNPLTSIKTFVQLSPQRKDDPEFFGEFSAVVCEDVARIERLIQEILDYAKYGEPKFQEEDLNEVVSSSLYFIKVSADTRSIGIDQELAEGLAPVMLDRQQIKQVLLNLFMNALHAMAKGDRLAVRTHALHKRDGGKWVQIEVSDTGCGIPAADLDHIFDPFYTTKHVSEEREGTGLGLTIVHQIIEEHGGYIEVQSEVGRGTTFFVNLPEQARRPQRESDDIKKPVLSADKTA